MHYFKENKGAVFILVILAVPVLFGMAAISLDMGYLYVVRNQLQNASDSSALAGASKLLYFSGGSGSESEAIAEAINYATQHTAAGSAITTGDVTVAVSSSAADFGVANYTGPAIQVCTRKNASLFFGGVWGFFGGQSMQESGVRACAVAGLQPLGGTCGLAPWAVGEDCAGGGGFTPGTPVTIHHSDNPNDPDASGVPGWFNPVRFPGSTGANDFRNNIINGSGCDNIIDIGETLGIEPGKMVGPTIQGLDQLTNNKALLGPPSSVVVILPLYCVASHTPRNPSDPVNVDSFAAFRILDYVDETIQIGKGAPIHRSKVTGTFEAYVSGGIPDPNAGSDVFVPQLVK